MNIWIIVIMVAILIIFTTLLLKDGPPQRKRQDDRDAAKADEIDDNPALLNQSQQAADLQVGEQDEARQSSRFEPDNQANQKWNLKHQE